MISCTTEPGTLQLVHTYNETGLTKRQIVCYIRAAVDGRLSVFYAYHRDWTRSVPRGPWDDQYTWQQSITPAIDHIIRACVLFELMDAFGGFDVRSVPGEFWQKMPNQIPFVELEKPR